MTITDYRDPVEIVLDALTLGRSVELDIGRLAMAEDGTIDHAHYVRFGALNAVPELRVGEDPDLNDFLESCQRLTEDDLIELCVHNALQMSLGQKRHTRVHIVLRALRRDRTVNLDEVAPTARPIRYRV